MKMMLAGVAAAGLIQATLFAQIASPSMPMPHRPEMKPITKTETQTMVAQHFAALDLNHDGKITQEEIRAGRMARFEKMRQEHHDREFARLDSNHDGSISKAEFDVPHMPPPPGGPGGPDGRGPRPEGPARGPMGRPMEGPMGGHSLMMMGPHWFDRADANHDGAVTLAEAQAAAGKLFDRLDTNHDGTISPDEIRAAMGGRRFGGRGGPEGPGGPEARGGRGFEGPHGPVGPAGPGRGYDAPGGADMPPPPPQN